MSWYLSVLKQYAVFQGRSRRKEYWMFFLFNTIINFLLIVLHMALMEDVTFYQRGFAMFPIYSIYSLAVFLPVLGVSIRRLHDIGKGGWWVLLNFIPVIGNIWFIVLMCMDGSPGENEYGPNPKEEIAEAAAA